MVRLLRLTFAVTISLVCTAVISCIKPTSTNAPGPSPESTANVGTSPTAKEEPTLTHTSNPELQASVANPSDALEITFLSNDGFTQCGTTEVFVISGQTFSFTKSNSRCPNQDLTKQVNLSPEQRSTLLQKISALKLFKVKLPCPSDFPVETLTFKFPSHEVFYRTKLCQEGELELDAMSYREILTLLRSFLT